MQIVHPHLHLAIHPGNRWQQPKSPFLPLFPNQTPKEPAEAGSHTKAPVPVWLDRTSPQAQGLKQGFVYPGKITKMLHEFQNISPLQIGGWEKGH